MNYLKSDEQTTNDLALFGEPGEASIFNIYNKTQTGGGSRRLEKLFEQPLSDEQAINKRSERFSFFSRYNFGFPVDTGAVGTLDYYMRDDDIRTQLQPRSKTISQRLKDTVSTDSNEVIVEDGVRAFLTIFSELKIFLEDLQEHITGSPYQEEYNRVKEILENDAFMVANNYTNANDNIKLNLSKIAELDKLIRFEYRELTLELLDMLYRLDVYITVGKVAREKEFNFAHASSHNNNQLWFNQIWHPLVEGAIANDLKMDKGQNLTFLTGANMAGKSTLMKAIGVALYLAHIGLPVAAEEMEFSVRDGIYTNINLSDNLQNGISHFYAEVMRVKDVSRLLQERKKLFIIFDELFRGTNVKDAYDGTVELARAFSKKKESQFIISTHIMEAGEHLSKEDLSIQYVYLPTEMKGNKPVYSRILQEGITDDRKGMAIIENENILQLLEEGIKNQEELWLS